MHKLIKNWQDIYKLLALLSIYLLQLVTWKARSQFVLAVIQNSNNEKLRRHV